MKRGLFVTFEGIDACGKSIQIRLLEESLKREGLQVRLIREPGGTHLGEDVRHILKHVNYQPPMSPIAELLLFNASRAQLVENVIAPALKKGEIILSDRFYDSTRAYQAYGRELNRKMVEQIIDVAVQNTRPDLTILFDISLEESKRRRNFRSSKNAKTQVDRFDDETDIFLKKVREGYLDIASHEPERVKIINAERSIAKIRSEVYEAVKKAYDKTLH